MNLVNTSRALNNFIENGSLRYQTYTGDELLKRRELRRYHINLLIALKFSTRALKAAHERGELPDSEYRKFKAQWGRFAADVMCYMNKRIKLKAAKYRAIFNIPAEIWKANYGHKEPSGVINVVYIKRLSAEPLACFVIEAMNEELIRLINKGVMPMTT